MHHPSESSLTIDAWRTYGYWAFWVGIAFFSVYPTCNWLTSLRDETYALYVPAELGIPFWPEFIWIYLSMYVLFSFPPFFLGKQRLRVLGKQLVIATILCGIAFLAVPTHLGFARVVPDAGLYQAIFQNLFIIDQPHNMAPSLHIVFSAMILLALLDVIRRRPLRLLLWLWLVLICASTLVVHQHHLIDVFTGLLVVVLLRIWITPREISV